MVEDVDKRRAAMARLARTWVEETVASEKDILTDRLFGNAFDPETAREAHAYGHALNRVMSRLVSDMEADIER